MSNQNQNLWGFVSDEDTSLKAQTSNLNFGLNQRVKLKRFEYSTKTGVGGADGNPAIIIEFDINGTDKNTRIYDPTHPSARMYSRGVEISDKNSDDFKRAQMETVKSIKGVITHYLKAAGKTEEQIKAAYATVNSFESLANVAKTGLAEVINQGMPLDLFMQYQSKIQGKADRTYLDIPTSLIYGSFVTAHQEPVGEWKEEKEWVESEGEGSQVTKKGLRYVDQSGNVHKFQRDEMYMQSKVANMQQTGEVNGMAAAKPNLGNTQSTAANKTAW